MTSKDNALVETMARAMNPECFEPDVVAIYGDLWALRQQGKQRSLAKLALDAVRPSIEREALEKAARFVRTYCEDIDWQEPGSAYEDGFTSAAEEIGEAMLALIQRDEEEKS